MSDILTTAIDITFVLVMLGIVGGFIRLVKGPSLSDRVVALDMMTVLIVSFCGLYALRAEETAFLDVAIVVAIVGFLATIALARFVERASQRSAPPAGDAPPGGVSPQQEGEP